MVPCGVEETRLTCGALVVMLLLQWSWRAVHQSKEDHSRGLRSNGMFLAMLCFRSIWNLSLLPSFSFLLFGKGMSVLCLMHEHILEAHDLPGFIVSRLDRKSTFG